MCHLEQNAPAAGTENNKRHKSERIMVQMELFPVEIVRRPERIAAALVCGSKPFGFSGYQI